MCKEAVAMTPIEYQMCKCAAQELLKNPRPSFLIVLDRILENDEEKGVDIDDRCD